MKAKPARLLQASRQKDVAVRADSRRKDREGGWLEHVVETAPRAVAQRLTRMAV